MAEIELQFTEYFDGETVVIFADGRELGRAAELRTDLRTSLARIARLAVPAERPTLTFAIPHKGISTTCEIEASKIMHVRIELASGALKIRPVSHESYRREPRGFA